MKNIPLYPQVRNAITVEFFDSLGKTLDIVNMGLAVVDWMRDGETCRLYL